jgi:hypothetical protein
VTFSPCPKPEARERERSKLTRNAPPKRVNWKRARKQFKRAFLSRSYVLNIKSKKCEAPDCWRTDIHCAHVEKTRKNGGWWYEIAPLCSVHHAEQEGRTDAFDKKYGTDLRARAAAHAFDWKAFVR